MAETKWEEHALLVLKGLENAEKMCIKHSERIAQLENEIGNVKTILKIVSPLVGALLIDAIRSFFGGG